MTRFKFTNSTASVVAKIDADGISRMSCSIEHPEFVAWLAEGNTPEPADPDPVQPDPSDYDNVQDKKMKALALVMAAWSGKTPAQLKAAFKQAYDALP